jgi:hypothetical protein
MSTRRSSAATLVSETAKTPAKQQKRCAFKRGYNVCVAAYKCLDALNDCPSASRLYITFRVRSPSVAPAPAAKEDDFEFDIKASPKKRGLEIVRRAVKKAPKGASAAAAAAAPPAKPSAAKRPAAAEAAADGGDAHRVKARRGRVVLEDDALDAPASAAPAKAAVKHTKPLHALAAAAAVEAEVSDEDAQEHVAAEAAVLARMKLASKVRRRPALTRAVVYCARACDSGRHPRSRTRCPRSTPTFRCPSTDSLYVGRRIP